MKPSCAIEVTPSQPILDTVKTASFAALRLAAKDRRLAGAYWSIAGAGSCEPALPDRRYIRSFNAT
jgi:hypothetical protein